MLTLVGRETGPVVVEAADCSGHGDWTMDANGSEVVPELEK